MYTCTGERTDELSMLTVAAGTQNHQGACSVAASYKPPMLVTRVRLPACAYFPCACCSCGVVLVLIPRITAAVDHESQHALDPNQPHQETDIDIRFALH